LIGREHDVDRLLDVLAHSRLVTVIGAGGVGKTQLALEVARRLAPSFPDGAAFVGLADLDEPGLVAVEIARCLDLVDVSGPEPQDALHSALRSLRMLLVIDNFEHLVDAAPVLADVARECPGIKLLVTSRRRLAVAVERTFALAPLPVPATDVPADPDGAPAVELFCERASAVSSGFEPDRAALDAIGELCRLVDGIPLAIELVASHARWFHPVALLGGVRDPDHGLRLLRRRAGDVGARHRDLRDTIGWSVDLLGGAPRRLLSRLSVFREGWTPRAMGELCCWDMSEGEAFDALEELVDLHLVEPVHVAGADARFRLLETVRRFAGEVLAAAGEARPLRDRHADHYLAFALRAGDALQGDDDLRWAARVDRELPNVRAALQHAAASGRTDEALAVAAALGPYWLDRGPMREGREWLDRLLSSGEGSRRVRAVAEAWSARLALELGDIGVPHVRDARDERLRQARDVLDAEGDVTGWLRATDHLSNSLHLQGRFAEADVLLAGALPRCRTPETTWLRAELMLTRAVNAQDSGEFARDRVVSLFDEAIRAARLAGHGRAGAQAVGRMTITLPPHAPFVADAIAEVDQAFRLSQEHGDRRNAARSAVVAAVLALANHDETAAATWFVRALDLSVPIGYWHGVAWSVMGVAGMAAHAGRLVDGARLHGAVGPHLAQMVTETPRTQIKAYNRLVELLRDGLGERFDAVCRAGADLPWTVAVDEARRIAAELSGDVVHATQRSRRGRGPRANPKLTDRELDVLGGLVAGHTNQQIAATLEISHKTVMHHTVAVYRKLAVRGRAEAVAHALKTGLVTI
jgi:predicted ATPase/DNA-binding CsgD family transcriptional regulator